jgi:hypothetical protein
VIPAGDAADGAAAECGQLLTLGMDGMVAVWDARAGLAGGGEGRRGGGGAPAGVAAAAGGGGKADEDGLLSSVLVPGARDAGIRSPEAVTVWAPLYRALPKTERAYGMGVVAAALSEAAPTDPLLVLYSAGVLAAVDWAPDRDASGCDEWAALAEAGGGGGEGGEGGEGGAGGGAGGGGGRSKGSSRVLWATPEESVPEPVDVLRHPSRGDVFLVVCAGGWTLWRAHTRQPLLHSPPAPASYTAGAWSPSREPVFFLTRADGKVEAWDLLDSLSRPTVPPLAVASSPLASARFRPPVGGDKAQLLAVGDAKGALHVLEVPVVLRTPHGANEGALLTALVERERARVNFTLGRARKLAAEKNARDAREAAAKAAADAQAQKMEQELQCAWRRQPRRAPPHFLGPPFRGFLFTGPPHPPSPPAAALKSLFMDTDPNAAARLTYKDVQARKKAAAIAAAEVQFEVLQQQIMEQLGITAGDIVEVPFTPAAAAVAAVAGAAPPSPGGGAVWPGMAPVAFGRGGAPGKVDVAVPAAKKAPPAAPAAATGKGRK